MGIKNNLEQVLVNLISNACQALTSNRDAINVQTRADIERNCVIITVSDTGPGVETDMLKSLTEPFFSTKQTMGGTGLGLYISDKIIRSHGGKLTLTSKPRQGFTARISLPFNNNS